MSDEEMIDTNQQGSDDENLCPECRLDAWEDCTCNDEEPVALVLEKKVSYMELGKKYHLLGGNSPYY
jgi:hypothetical protein